MSNNLFFKFTGLHILKKPNQTATEAASKPVEIAVTATAEAATTKAVDTAETSVAEKTQNESSEENKKRPRSRRYYYR